ncbi:hypothetical protein K432DRAFT_430435 [Lepidopterella palustris CBS 459.81]|uniref:Xrn1 N-terminal domain-containing protein n=1 Tax=Lepidopterella palustris CBS 459.81 TaxID=1314670 RepID=A0A8E2DY17_9PEZI|nr:hypothetical protein K432DRAFT_430435 [Lepidopterella palustris CBS 459.81]
MRRFRSNILFGKTIEALKENMDIWGRHRASGPDRVPVDYTKPTTDGEEIDNLYLGINDTVHPCSHPEDHAARENETEMMISVFDCGSALNWNKPFYRRCLVAGDEIAPLYGTDGDLDDTLPKGSSKKPTL